MKIIGINGSPRNKANTGQLLNHILEKCEKDGHETKSFQLDRININGCKSCYACKTDKSPGRCVMKDDMNQLLEEILNADAIVLASPIYMWQVTGQTKLFVDRLMPLLKPDFSTFVNGQKLLCVYTQGQEDANKFGKYYDYVNSMFATLGFNMLPPLVASGVRMPDDILTKNDVLTKANESILLLNQENYSASF